jgi:RNA polymerase sigma-70 factor (ECF subfamily)
VSRDPLPPRHLLRLPRSASPAPLRTEPSAEAPPATFEETVRDALARGDLHAATTSSLRLYGAEVFGFLLGVLGDGSAARDVYASVAERVWRGLSAFAWRCSLRTWTYTIARNELARYRARTARRHAHQVPLSAISSPRAPDPTTTKPFCRTTVRNALSELRRELPPEDHELLVLRIDRRLSWGDLATASLGEDASEHEVARESARLRKRFQLLKERLTRLALDRGLLPTDGRS